MQMRPRHLAVAVFLWLSVVRVASGIILLDSADPTVNTITPGDNSGWQYEGYFNGYCATPIAPLYFITAAHIGGTVGDSFLFHGDTFVTTAKYPDPSSDLQIWKVDHAFVCYAPLYDQNGSETGKQMRVFGRGTQRGDPLMLGGRLRGWKWGVGDDVQRWGSNVVSGIILPPDFNWALLQAAFDSPGLPHEAHFSVGDSGGGGFILENGLWRLAAVNYSVDDLYTGPSNATDFAAAVFDARGYYTKDGNGNFVQIADHGVSVPTAFYSTQISARLAWIEDVTGIDPTVLPTETYSTWQYAYFGAAQIADPAVGGPKADTDGDGISNLLEFAFNLDPTYTEPAVMVAGTGLRGLPLIRLEQVAADDKRLTVEFVRRKSGGGSGLTYSVQFTSNIAAPASWQAGGTLNATSINARWERVKVTDATSFSGSTPRYARVVVSQ